MVSLQQVTEHFTLIPSRLIYTCYCEPACFNQYSDYAAGWGTEDSKLYL